MKKDKTSNHGIKEILADSRFSHIVSDPRYRNISSRKIKVHVDKRFKSRLVDEKFKVNATLDPRGKPKSYGTKAGLNKFYNLESSSDSEDEENESEGSKSDENSLIKNAPESKTKLTKKQSEKKKVKDKKKISKKKKSRKETDRTEEFMTSLLNPEKDLARGDTFYSDDSSDDDSSTTDEEEGVEELKEFEWGELDGDAHWDVDGNEIEETSRFAVCDMDWDNVKAVDLLVLFSSFAPSGGAVKKVTIYPSEFGKARMAEEDQRGPQELVRLAALHKKKQNNELSDLEKLKKGTLKENDEATSLELEALRRYQRNCMRYYYAVVECDSVETATTIYKECDRTHYEVAGATLDLRYIPSEMEFDEVPHDVCEKIPDSYEFENLQVASLTQSKPTLTWEETTRRRKKVLKNVMTQAMKKQNYNDDALNDFIAGSDTDDEEVEESEENEDEGRESKEERIAKFRALIAEIDEKETQKRDLAFDREDTFAAEQDKEASEGEESNERENDSKTHDETREGESESETLTPFEKMLMKKKEKRKERKLKVKKLKEKLSESDEKESGFEENENSSEEEVKPKKREKKVKRKSKGEKKEIIQESTDKDLALLVMNEEEEEKKHFDMRKIQEQKEKLKKNKRKRKNKKEKEEQENIDNFKVDVSDPRFTALFSHGDFNVDPSHPKYDKHSSLNQSIIQKQKKIKIDPENVSHQKVASQSSIDSDISDMIRRIRMKTSKLK